MLSVIIPARDRGSMLAATLQPWSGSPCEVIVVDDASTDDTATVASQLGCTVIRNDRQRGPGAARNAGLAAASGEYVLFLDSDIVVDDGFAERLADTHRAVEDVVLVGMRCQLPESGDLEGSPRRDSRELLGDLYSYNLARHPAPWALAYSCALSAPRSLLCQVALRGDREVFDSGFQQWGLEDIELGLRLHQAGARWAFLLGPSSLHQFHDRSMTPERFAGWRDNLARMIERHPGAVGYAALADVFDPAKKAAFLERFHAFAGPAPRTPRATVIYDESAELAQVQQQLKTTTDDTTVYAVVPQYHAAAGAQCAVLADTHRVALFPADAWERLGLSLLAQHPQVEIQESTC